MTTMIREVYEALKEAGASEERSVSAAAAIEDLRDESRLRSIEREIAEVKADVRVVKWMLGFLLALGVANLWLLIRMALGGPLG